MINLKTHTVYPELKELPNNVISIKLIDGKGNTKFEDMVVGKDLAESKSKAKAIISEQALKYIKE